MLLKVQLRGNCFPWDCLKGKLYDDVGKKTYFKHGNSCVIVCLNAMDANDLCRYTNIHKYTQVYIYSLYIGEIRNKINKYEKMIIAL